MRQLSKSKILAYRQCPKRLWLEIHRPDLRDDSASEAVFRIGNEVGEVARRIYDKPGGGVFIDVDALGFEGAFAKSAELLRECKAPIFEAGFHIPGALAFADVMVPDHSGGRSRWHMIEVKSSSGFKDYHRDDIAVQCFVAEAAGVDLVSVSLAHVDTSFLYAGDGKYEGLLKAVDFTDEAKSRRVEVGEWMEGAQVVAALPEEPEISPGKQCGTPFPCAFCAYCDREEIAVDYPLSFLPNFSGRKRDAVEGLGIHDLRDVPDEFLTPIQKRVRDVTRSGDPFLDLEGAAAALNGLGNPVRFLDFESVMLAVPVWKGTRPYQQIPFQFSLHCLDHEGALTHESFLDLSGADPSKALAKELIRACGDQGPVFAYNATFEKMVIQDLGKRFPPLRPALHRILERVVDLLPVAKARYYHPAQHGRWGLKSILPAAFPELSYDHLDGVADGAMAVDVFKEAIAPGTTEDRKSEIERELLAYCHLDTLGLVRLWKLLSGKG